ncbi:T9SS type A sorting domain-containing protein, partial [bacterium]
VKIFNGWKGEGPVYPSKLLIDKSNTLWFGFSVNSSDFYSYKNKTLTNYTELKYKLPPLNVSDLCVDSNNNIWVVSSEEAKTYEYISSDDKWVNFDSTNSTLGKDHLYSKGISVSNDNKVWLVPGKLFSFPPRFLTYYKNGEWKKFSIDDVFVLDPKNGLSLLTLAVDSKNNVWIGTDKGLIKFNEAKTTVSTFEENNIKLYPNPTNDILYIDLSDKHVFSFSITDITGKILKQDFHNFKNQITIDTKSLTTGIYFINLKLSDNQTIQSKFVKE